MRNPGQRYKSEKNLQKELLPGIIYMITDVTYSTYQNPPQSTGSPRSQDEGIFFK